MKLLLIAATSCLTISTGLFLTLKHYQSRDKVIDGKITTETETVQPAELPLTNIACGSCFKANFEGANEIWNSIAATNPQLFLFMGDNIYADTYDMDVMRKKYQALNALPAYVNFSNDVPILPIWDDHDYGLNDVGSEYPKKAESQQIFLDAFDFPEEHPARNQEGIYHSHTQGPEGKVTQIINLDTRYHRSLLDQRKVGRKKHYFPVTSPDATILGETQWQWLEQELLKPADLRVIVSSIQIISSQHRFEKWSNIPAERQRFLDLLKKTNTKRVILLSGDRHIAEISKLTKEQTGLSYDLLELTSSGMTHSGHPRSVNPFYLEGSFVNIINFGSLTINWDQSIPKVTMNIMNKKSESVFQTTASFNE